MAESCYDDSTPAGPSSFIKLVGKYGYCQDDLTLEDRPALDPCNDLYILMCFAAAQVAVGSVQILSCVIGRLKGKGSKVSDAEAEVDGTNTDDASNGGMTVLGVLSWIAGIIMLTIYTNAENAETGLPNADSERFYNSFQAAVILNVVLFAFGLLFIVTMTGIFVFTFIFKKGRLGTLFTFIFSVIVMGIAVSFYGCIAFYGWPYVHGDCKEAIQSYEGFKTNNFTVTIDGSLIAASFDADGSETDKQTKKLEADLNALINQKLIAGPQADCLVDDDCPVKFDVCNEQYECVSTIPDSTEKFYKDETGGEGTNETTTEKTTTKAPAKEPECAKGLDCDPGHTCNKNKECVANEGTKCGSKRDCLEFGKPNCVEGACVASVPALNDYGNEYGRIFYETSCTLQTDTTRETGPWKFVCEYQYEADAIIHNVVDEEEEEEANEDDANYDAEDDYTNIECKLLDLQFRDFQVETVKLEALKNEGLKVNECVIENSVIPTPEPPAPTQPVPEVTTEVDAPETDSTKAPETTKAPEPTKDP